MGQGRQVKLLNVEVSIGKVRILVKDPAQFLSHAQRAMACVDDPNQSVPVSFEGVPVVEEFLEWLPEKSPWDRLYKTAAPHAGYFTLADARAAGYTPDLLESLVREERVEQCSGEVYRLVQFPPSEHEDLVILWLQTDQKGVVSHETALALHDLSDILPAKRHITVPPPWDQGSRRLDADVVLHRADVGETEVVWRGPFPLTHPLRTVRDCIAVGVSPELIDQAIAAGVRRGLFTAADFPSRERAESA
jgi:hypothetical protein